MKENQIVTMALERLEKQTGIHGQWKPAHKELDGKLNLFMQPKNLRMFVEVKKELRQHMLPHIFEMAEKYQPLMVVAENIFPKLKEILREKKIAYLDTAGNIYANIGNNFIWIDGNKPLQEKKPVTNRAFTKTGLKTVFYLLLNKDAINMPHRKLAEVTEVALGNIKNVIEGLRGTGFVLQVNDTTLKLQNKNALFERWITGYREILKPALQLGTYNFGIKIKCRTGKHYRWRLVKICGEESRQEKFSQII